MSDAALPEPADVAPTPDTIVVPLDGSPRADMVLPVALRLATAWRARVVLLTVPQLSGLDIDEVNDLGAGLASEEALEAVAAATRQLPTQARTWLEERAATFVEAGIDADAEVAAGQPARAIIEVAASHPGSFVLMTRRGRGGGRGVLGSVAERVLHTTDRPLLLVRAGDPPRVPPPGPIVVALDRSPAAERILPIAAVVARALEEELRLVHVVPRFDDVPGEVRELIAARQTERVDAYFADLCRRLPGLVGSPTPMVETEVLGGESAVDGLVRRQIGSAVGALAMTTAGWRRVEVWPLGSVAKRVVREVDVPILTQRFPRRS